MEVIKKREMYACSHGDYTGQMFVVIEVKDQQVNCLQVPDMKNIQIPTDTFDIGRNSHIIELVEVVPKDVFEVTTAQYKQNENSNN
tara:strand:- start:4551 stop:4808 length:258 start_codon:yes stop_codon:yes gene_type:complete